jgi:cellulose synthase/poly-beta-1,6-N-acetylglucosamine synthase-like glycosyltransferase
MRTVFEAIVWALGVYFAVYLVGTLVMMIVAAVVARRRRHELLPSTLRHIMRAELAPTISVCIPAYNESAVVVDTVRSLLALDYPQVEVVLANDGSTDAMLDVLRAEFDLQPSARPRLGDLPHRPIRGLYEPRSPIPLLVVDKENGGRSDALNAAIVHARGPLVAVMDADEVLGNDALVHAIRPFLADPLRTVAAGASLGIANGCRIVRGRIVKRDRPRRILPLFQAVEYERAFRIARVASSAVRAMPIISGGFGVFRRDVLIAAGGYDSDTLGEDFDLTLRLHRFCRDRGLPYRIAHVPDVVCWTLVPDSGRVLRRQRRRWHRGLQQVLSKHRGMAFRQRYGFVGFGAVPWAAAYELITPLIVVLGTLITVLGLAAGYIGWQLLVLGAFATWACVVAPTLAALLMTQSPAGSSTGWGNLAAIVAAAFTDFAYQCLTLVYRLESMLMPRRSIGWGEMERSLPGGG